MVLSFFLIAYTFFFISCATAERNNPNDPGSENFIGIVYGSPVTYGGETYETIVIGKQTWMARNFNYDVADSKCYDNDPANCTKYGRLYDWETAMTICPSGWHLPSMDDWDTLTIVVGGVYSAGKHLKATTNGNGLDSYGFAALLGGYGDFEGNFSSIGIYSYFWSSSASKNTAFRKIINYASEAFFSDNGYKGDLFSVRCLQD